MMKHFRFNLKFVLYLLALMMVKFSFAAGNIEVVTAEGSVMVGDAQGKMTKAVHSKSVLLTGNVLSTGPDARAVVRVGTDGFVVLGKNSKIEINQSNKEKPGFFKQISGIIYYAINSIKGKKRSMEVRTATTTIGIRGTRFLVTDFEGRTEIGMRKGVVSVTSTDGDFEIHTKSEQNAFEAFKQEGEAAMAQSEREFEAYKTKTQQEFVEFKREFSLEENRMASFDGNRVVERPLSGETKKDMDSIENYAEEWLKNVQD